MTFDRKLLIANLGRLSKRHRIAFAASCAGRLLPTYNAFCREMNWGDPELFRKSIDAVWEGLDGESLSEDQVRQWMIEVDDMTPRSDDFSSPLTTAAQNAGISLIHVLSCWLDGSAEEAAWAGNAAFETVDEHVRELDGIEADDPELASKVDGHPLMVRELRKQVEDLALLQKDECLGTATLLKLRHGWQNAGKSNIDLG